MTTVNKIEIVRRGFVDKYINIPVELNWDYTGVDEQLDEYEAKVVQQVIGTGRDFEVSRFAHAPTTGLTQTTEINYEFYFYSGGSVTDINNWSINYQSEGFTTQDIYYFSNSFANSFFKLDFYDTVDQKRQKNFFTIILPTQQGLTMDAVMQRTPVKIKKPKYILDYNGDKEGFFIYWLKSRQFLNISTFYMTAKFYDAKRGGFTKMMTGRSWDPQSETPCLTPYPPANPDLTLGPQSFISCNSGELSSFYTFDNSQYFYYQVQLDYQTQTYQVFNTFGQRMGTDLPIKWFEYVNPR